MLDDPKIGTLPDWAFRRWIEFLLVAKEYDHGGLLQPVCDLAWRLRLPETAVSEALRALERVGVVRESSDGWLIVNFAKRQAAAESAERVKQYRARKKAQQEAESGIVTKRYENETDLQRNVTGSETKGYTDVTKRYNSGEDVTKTLPNVTDTEEETESEGEAEQKQKNAAAADFIPNFSPSAQAEKVFQEITGFVTFIPYSQEKDVGTLLALMREHGAGTATYCKPFFEAWTKRGYSRTNTAWLDWCVSGEIGKSKKNGKVKTAAETASEKLAEHPAMKDPGIREWVNYLRLNGPNNKLSEKAREKLKAKGWVYANNQLTRLDHSADPA
jgi:hypothetical protein